MKQAKRTIKLASHMSVIGVDDPEKVAQGQCPCCDCAVELWVTNNGMELSAHDNGYEHPTLQSHHPFQQMLKRIFRMLK